MNSLPQALLDRLKSIYWENGQKNVISWFSSKRKTTFRINTLKSSKEEIENYLKEKSIPFGEVDFLKWVYVTWKEYEYTLKWSDIFYSWKIYVQWISSMLPVYFMGLENKDVVLDMTAAPGSKTTQMSAIMENSWKIYALEQNKIRFDKLNYNIKLQWATNVETLKMDARKIEEKFNDGFFDKILLDAPCSAEWRISLENEKSFGFWSLKNIQDKNVLQEELLEIAFKKLKSWWVLIYSTCTLAPEENEEVINYILEKHPSLSIAEISLENELATKWITWFGWKSYSQELSKTIRIMPSELTEGFFMAKLRKS